MDIRIRLFIVATMGAIIALTWTFPTWYPLLNQETITEAYVGLPLDAQALYLSLSQAEREGYELLRDGDPDDEDINPRPDLALTLVESRILATDVQTPEEEQLFESPSDVILRSAEFRQIEPIRGAQGNITIYQLNDLSRILRIDNNFRSTRAPNIHVILTRNPDPTDIRGVGADYLDLGELTGNVGGQTFGVPTDIDFSIYPIMALYLPDYDYVLSTATLR